MEASLKHCRIHDPAVKPLLLREECKSGLRRLLLYEPSLESARTGFCWEDQLVWGWFSCARGGLLHGVGTDTSFHMVASMCSVQLAQLAWNIRSSPHSPDPSGGRPSFENPETSETCTAQYKASRYRSTVPVNFREPPTPLVALVLPFWPKHSRGP